MTKPGFYSEFYGLRTLSHTGLKKWSESWLVLQASAAIQKMLAEKEKKRLAAGDSEASAVRCFLNRNVCLYGLYV